jgi:hypothetical protein
MAKDKNGKAFALGDRVTLTGTVTMIFGSADAAEMLFEPDEKALAGHKTQVPLNSRQVEIVPAAPPKAVAGAPDDATQAEVQPITHVPPKG